MRAAWVAGVLAFAIGSVATAAGAAEIRLAEQFSMGYLQFNVMEHEKLLEDPAKWHEFYGDLPCWVFTHRALPPIPNADIRFVQGEVRPAHEEMTAAAGGKNIWLVGGGELVGSFADEGLLDEIQLHVAPVTLGAGAQLLPRRLTSPRLTLTNIERVGGFAYLTYRVG